MRISGFSMVRNATKLFYPVKESIASILPLVDEFVIAVGQGDSDDHTRELIESLESSKVKVIETVWDTEAFPNGTENAHQTDIAKEACTGDWLFYLQADEVVHEKFLPEIEEKCSKYLNDERVEGFLLNYLHFWGDFWHYVPNHGWYPREIRIIRNDPDIHSWRSAQSFRRIPGFDGKNYRQKEGTQKLHVVPLDAYVYHYGWVRPPHLMQKKKKALANIHKESGKEKADIEEASTDFDYGYLNRLPAFNGTHPQIMEDWIGQFNWGEELKPELVDDFRESYRHERLSNRILTWLEQNMFGGRQLFTNSNWHIVER